MRAGLVDRIVEELGPAALAPLAFDVLHQRRQLARELRRRVLHGAEMAAGRFLHVLMIDGAAADARHNRPAEAVLPPQLDLGRHQVPVHLEVALGVGG